MLMRLITAAVTIVLLLAFVPVNAVRAAGDKVTVGHGFSMYGDLKYGPGFGHFDYANPAAPKGGSVKLAALGTFDTLNPFILKGVPAAGIGGIFGTLTAPAQHRAFSEYRLAWRTHAVAA